jgi:uncharacterized protein
MFVSALRIEFHIPATHSLKEKRAVIRPIIDGLRNRYRVSVAEICHQDLWQRATIGIAVVGADVSTVEDVLTHCERFVESFPEIEILELQQSWLDAE